MPMPPPCKKPLVIDGYCGLGGWSEAFIAQGWECIGIDIERHDYGNGSYPGQLILQDMRTIRGEQFKDADALVFSPPCTEFSYMAMPWKRGKQIAAALRGDGEFPKGYRGSRTVADLTDLFNQCFRIQREVSEAAGHHVPMVVENVRGAQRWVGKARWNFGSFYLWGDVPALMPIPGKAVLKNGVTHRTNGQTNFHSWEGMKLPEGNAKDRLWKNRPIAKLCDALKSEGYTFGWKAPPTISKSKARKQASAEIAKIPFTLASWIARVYLPRNE